jgi:hypothetical protein
VPVGWLTFGTPRELQDLLDRRDFDGFEAEVDRRVSDAGAVTLSVLWDYKGSKAHVVVAVPQRSADEVFTVLEDIFETRVTRLVNLQELKRGGSGDGPSGA